jgi:hypothetical protein
LGLIGAPIRLSMRAGRENPYAPKKQRGRREVLSVTARLDPAIHAMIPKISGGSLIHKDYELINT